MAVTAEPGELPSYQVAMVVLVVLVATWLV